MKDSLMFRVYPELAKSKRYYLVRIFRTKELMYAFAKQSPHYELPNSRGFKLRFDFEAICTAFDRLERKGGRWKRHHNIGHILFYTGGFGAGVVAHEITHATVYWAARHTRLNLARLRSDQNTDERFADVLGSMVAQFWSAYWRRCRKYTWLQS